MGQEFGKPPDRFKAVDDDFALNDIMDSIFYQCSPYHIQVEKQGRLPEWRVKPASRCPKDITFEMALGYLQEGLTAGAFSDLLSNGYPSRVWSYVPDRESNQFFEAKFEGIRPVNGIQCAVYHGYPVGVDRKGRPRPKLNSVVYKRLLNHAEN